MVYVFRRSDCKISIFFFKCTKQSTFNSKDGYVLVFVKISYYQKKHAIYILLILAEYHENPKPVTLSFPTSYGYRSVLAKLII